MWGVGCPGQHSSNGRRTRPAQLGGADRREDTRPARSRAVQERPALHGLCTVGCGLDGLIPGSRRLLPFDSSRLAFSNRFLRTAGEGPSVLRWDLAPGFPNTSSGAYLVARPVAPPVLQSCRSHRSGRSYTAARERRRPGASSTKQIVPITAPTSAGSGNPCRLCLLSQTKRKTPGSHPSTSRATRLTIHQSHPSHYLTPTPSCGTRRPLAIRIVRANPAPNPPFRYETETDVPGR